MKLLLAEDEVDLAKALETVLKHSNYTVDVVYDGQDARDYLLNDSYDAAILDIMMPKLDGISVLSEIRKHGVKIPVLFLTAKSEVEDKVIGLDAGADDYLTKPFAMKELLARIRAMMRRKEDVLQSTLQYGNVSLDPNTYELRTNQKTFRLANKEYQIMELFLSNPNQVLSTERLMGKIWGYESNSEINVVWVNISSLRKKLVSMDADVVIRANRGIGYSLERIDENKR